MCAIVLFRIEYETIRLFMFLVRLNAIMLKRFVKNFSFEKEKLITVIRNNKLNACIKETQSNNSLHGNYDAITPIKFRYASLIQFRVEFNA